MISKADHFLLLSSNVQREVGKILDKDISYRNLANISFCLYWTVFSSEGHMCLKNNSSYHLLVPFVLHRKEKNYQLCGNVGNIRTLKNNLTQFSSVAQSCPTLCDPMDCSTPGLPVHHQLLELIQTHIHWVSDAIQPSHPLSSPSPPAFNLTNGLQKMDTSGGDLVSKTGAGKEHCYEIAFSWVWAAAHSCSGCTLHWSRQLPSCRSHKWYMLELCSVVALGMWPWADFAGAEISF